MIKFLFKGLLRDRSRSLFPILTVFLGVLLTVVFYGWIQGAMTNMIDANARFSTGHVKIMSRAYAKEVDQIPNDLAFIGVEKLTQDLRKKYPDLIWVSRIKFGGLLDIPDKLGETRDQGPVSGMAVDLFSSETREWEILNLSDALVRGRLPEKRGEILIGEKMARQLNVKPGETATLIGSTMYGSMAMANFTVAGTIRFGITALDRGAMIADISDIRAALNMEDASGEILGLFNDFVYRDEQAEEIKAAFNAGYAKDNDEFLPVMDTLPNQSGMADYLEMVGTMSVTVLAIYIIAMSIVLWNASLMGSLRRYGEIGVRLAMGETKGHLYRSLISESLMVGFIGSALGTAVGLAITYFLQEKGINISGMMKNASILFSDVMRARITPACFFIGFLPGLVATFLGASISGIGIYKRKTSHLMKELEA
ncbi:MAG: FtsX-like permease family protein [Acidobacteriota bacterium]|nr:FtsX-like permease family protein [Acidobacteriota bacterium]